MTVTHYGPGEAPGETAPGSFILTHRRSFPSTAIAFGQALRFRGLRRPFAHYSHAALLIGAEGQLIEALGNGVVRTNLSRYRDVEFHLVEINADVLERGHVCRYAQAMVDRHEAYSWWEIASLGLELLTGSRVGLTTDAAAICSGLVATALERTGAIFPRNAGCMRPADLAEYFNVRP